jgi:hypothetical protein
MVRDLKDPGARSTLRRIEQCGLTKNEEKNLLYEIVGFRFVPQYPVGNVAHGVGMAAEEKTKLVLRSFADLPKQKFIGNLRKGCNGLDSSFSHVVSRWEKIERFG